VLDEIPNMTLVGHIISLITYTKIAGLYLYWYRYLYRCLYTHGI